VAAELEECLDKGDVVIAAAHMAADSSGLGQSGIPAHSLGATLTEQISEVIHGGLVATDTDQNPARQAAPEHDVRCGFNRYSMRITAGKAQNAANFEDEIAPVEIPPHRAGPIVFAKDEFPRAGDSDGAASFDAARLNISGSTSAHCHPVGASGARTLFTPGNGMQRGQAVKGLATLSIGGDQGVARMTTQPGSSGCLRIKGARSANVCLPND